MITSRLIATLTLLGTLTLGMAEVTVDDQIAAIVGATPEERVALVNDFKETLATMNDDERAAAIAQMRSSVSSTGEQTQTQTRQRSRIGQMEQTDEMQRTQQMSQKRTGSQAMQQGNIGAGAGTGTQNRFMGNK